MAGLGVGSVSIFPEDADDDIIELFDPDDDIDLTDTDEDEPVPYGFTWTFDFNREDLDFSRGDPPKVSGIRTVGEWITHTLNTELFETPIFDGDIGTDIFKLIGDGLDAGVIQEVEEEILEAILVHDRITDVTTEKIVALGTDIIGIFRSMVDDGTTDVTVVQVS